MGRTPTLPKLAQLDPKEVALSVARSDLDAIITEAGRLYGSAISTRGLGNIDEPELEKSAAYRGLRKLGDYAKAGRSLDVSFETLIERLLPILRRALELDATTVAQVVAVIDTVGEETPLGVVLCAARGRAQLEAGHALTASQLAALASSSRRTIFNLIEDGTLRATRREALAQKKHNPYLVPAKDARTYLSAQDVPGLPASTRSAVAKRSPR